jgi:phage/plasmid primase-like uncharacterized protein
LGSDATSFRVDDDSFLERIMSDYTRDEYLSALVYLDPGVGRDEWRKIGVSGIAAGLTIEDIDTWSSTASNYKGTGDVKSAFKDVSRCGKITDRTLVGMALEAGWRPEKNTAQQTQKPVKPAPEKQVKANHSAEVWSRLETVSTHPYAIKKKLSTDTLKLCRVVPANDPLTHRRGWLAIPGRDIEGNLVTIEFIDPNAKPGDPKPALKDSKKSGSMFCVGADKGNIFVCEGLATADSVYQATGELSVSTFGSCNTKNVVSALRKKHPEKRIVICPDTSKESDAKKIADEFHCAVAAMPDGWAGNSDLNDVFCRDGYDVIQDTLYAAEEPSATVEPPTAYPLTISWADQLTSSYEPPDELVEGLLTAGDGSVLYGESNSGKTFLALDIACAVARGVPWQGRRVEKGLVLYLACESVSSVKGRLQAYQLHHNCRVPGFCIVENPIDLFADECDTEKVIFLIKQIEHQTNQKVRLIVGDTLARLTAGGDENRGADMGLVVRRFDRIRTEISSHFLLVHHSGKNAANGARGWSGLRAAIDTEFEVTDSPSGRCLEITKQRDLSTKGQRIGFKLESIVLGENKWGEQATSCVVVAGNAPEKKSSGKRMGECEGAVIEFLTAHKIGIRKSEVVKHFDGRYEKGPVYRAMKSLVIACAIHEAAGMVCIAEVAK